MDEKVLERRRLATRKYEKTVNGFLMRVYRNMTSRVTGVQKQKAHLYLGLEILPKSEFYAWSKRNKSFQSLYKFWVKLNYDRLSTPSIDRIDSSKGYVKGNMQWITSYENSVKGTESRYGRVAC